MAYIFLLILTKNLLLILFCDLAHKNVHKTMVNKERRKRGDIQIT